MAASTVPYIQTTDAVVGQGHATLPDVANRVIRFLLSKCGFNPDAPFTGLQKVHNVIAYGAVGDGVTDDYAAFAAAVTAARADNGTVFVPCTAANVYKLSQTLVLASSTLAFVALYGDASCPTLDFTGASGFTVDCSGTNTTTGLVNAGTIRNITLKNSHTTANDGSLKAFYTAMLRLENVKLVANGKALACTETIGAMLHNVYATSTGGANGLYGKHGGSRNLVWRGGRVYGFQVAIQASGDSHLIHGVNIEFCDVAVQTQAANTVLFDACHFETTTCLLTNANTIPIVAVGGGNWVDNGSAGIGLTGGVMFNNCYIGLAGYSAQTNFIVLKTQASFTYELMFNSCYVSHTNLKIRGSFTPGASTQVPSGTCIKTYGRSAGTIDVAIPLDNFSQYVQEQTNLMYFSQIISNQLTVNSGVDGMIGQFQSGFPNAGVHLTNNAAGGRDYSLQSTSTGSGWGSGRLAIVSGAGAGSTPHLAVDASGTADDTRLLVWDVSDNVWKRATRGPIDSAGSGFRTLRIPN